MERALTSYNMSHQSPKQRYAVSPVATVAYIRSQMRGNKSKQDPAKNVWKQNLSGRQQNINSRDRIDSRNGFVNELSIPAMDETNPVFGIDASRCPVFERKLPNSGKSKDYRLNDLDREETATGDVYKSQSYGSYNSQTVNQDSPNNIKQRKISDAQIDGLKETVALQKVNKSETKEFVQNCRIQEASSAQQRMATNRAAEYRERQASVRFNKITAQLKHIFSHRNQPSNKVTDNEKQNSTYGHFDGTVVPRSQHVYPGIPPGDPTANQTHLPRSSLEAQEVTRKTYYPDAKRIKIEPEISHEEVHLRRFSQPFGQQLHSWKDNTKLDWCDPQKEPTRRWIMKKDATQQRTVAKDEYGQAQMSTLRRDSTLRSNNLIHPARPNTDALPPVQPASGVGRMPKSESLTWDPGQTALTSTPMKPLPVQAPPSVTTESQSTKPSADQQGRPADHIVRYMNEQVTLSQAASNQPICVSNSGKVKITKICKDENSYTPDAMLPRLRTALSNAYTQFHRRARNPTIHLPNSVPAEIGRTKLQSKEKLKPVNLFPDLHVQGSSTTQSDRFGHSNAETHYREANKIGSKEECKPKAVLLSRSNVPQLSTNRQQLLSGSIAEINHGDSLRTKMVNAVKKQSNIEAGHSAAGRSYRLLSPQRHRASLPLGNKTSARVRHAKSVDIAAIYSQLPRSTRKSSDLDSFKENRHRAQTEQQTQTGTSSRQPDIPESNEATGNGYSSHEKQTPNNGKYKFSLNDYSSFQNEEFRPGMEFLKELENTYGDSGSPLNAITRQSPLCVRINPQNNNSVQRKSLPLSNLQTTQQPDSHLLLPSALKRSSEYLKRSSEHFNTGMSNISNQSIALHKATPLNIPKHPVSAPNYDFKGSKQHEVTENSHLKHAQSVRYFQRQHPIRDTLHSQLNIIHEQNFPQTFHVQNSPTDFKSCNGPNSYQKPAAKVSTFSPSALQLENEYFYEADSQTSRVWEKASGRLASRNDLPKGISQNLDGSLHQSKSTVHLLSTSRQTSSETLSSGYRSLDRKENSRRSNRLPMLTAENNGRNEASDSFNERVFEGPNYVNKIGPYDMPTDLVDDPGKNNVKAYNFDYPGKTRTSDFHFERTGSYKDKNDYFGSSRPYCASLSTTVSNTGKAANENVAKTQMHENALPVNYDELPRSKDVIVTDPAFSKLESDELASPSVMYRNYFILFTMFYYALVHK
ncbi:hypothetical protein Bpfe_022691 [Biomphalaria pfeifferi]|uniref:Uncharacterized protein n=1 Tax=Biomphalaria pfeifferi TaxID=112525 RepID=A0AAD8B4I6_BIOPF|nr:hypothetical protein Bpfe_022691 [Biomphalaria pfeifferi]